MILYLHGTCRVIALHCDQWYSGTVIIGSIALFSTLTFLGGATTMSATCLSFARSKYIPLSGAPLKSPLCSKACQCARDVGSSPVSACCSIYANSASVSIPGNVFPPPNAAVMNCQSELENKPGAFLLISLIGSVMILPRRGRFLVHPCFLPDENFDVSLALPTERR